MPQWDPPALAYAFHTSFIDCSDGGVLRATGGLLRSAATVVARQHRCLVSVGVLFSMYRKRRHLPPLRQCNLLSTAPSAATCPSRSPQAGCAWVLSLGGTVCGAGGLFHGRQ